MANKVYPKYEVFLFQIGAIKRAFATQSKKESKKFLFQIGAIKSCYHS